MAKIDDSVKKKVPELRFKGFTDDWEERKLGDAVSISSGVTGDAILQDGKYRLTRIESISQGMLNVGRLGFTNEKPDQKYLLNLGDILYSNINSLSHIGKVALVDTTGIYHGINLLRFQMRNGVDSEFLFQRLNTMPMKNWAVSHANPAVSQASINQTELSKQPISSPTLTEQQQIGNFFKEIDNIIGLHQRKLDLLKEQKKGFLQKMFPKNGAKVPELRFAGFADDWEERKLGDLANIVRGASPRPIQDSKWFDKDSDIGWLRISDVTDQNGRIHHLEQRISKLGQEKTRVLKEPHLLLSIAATVGKPLVNYVKTGVHDGFLIFLNPSFEREFMFQWLEMFRPNWKKYGQPGSQVNLNSELVRNQEIPLPSIEEQQKIGSFFKHLDDTIALHQRKLDLLKEQKKGYLQKMFV